MTFKIRREEEAAAERQYEQRPHTAESDREYRIIHNLLAAAYREQRSARIWRNVWRTVGTVMFFSLLFTVHSCAKNGGRSDTDIPLSGKQAKPHTAVISLTGQIGGERRDQTEILREGLAAAYRNKNVKGIIIRADSPGGSPVVSNTAFGELRRLKEQHKDIPLYVVVENMCASGCYYIAAAADKIYADPSSLVGSIGVIGGSFDFTGLMEKIGVKRRLRTAGSNKGMGDPFSPETPEQQAIWQQMLNDIHGEFIKAVRTGRGSRLKEKETPDLFSGRIFTGIEGQKAGLTDGFGNIYTVARDVIHAEELVDYTPEDDNLAAAIRRRIGTETQSGIRRILEETAQEKGW